MEKIIFLTFFFFESPFLFFNLFPLQPSLLLLLLLSLFFIRDDARRLYYKVESADTI